MIKLIWIIFFITMPATVFATKIALVIGNSEYQIISSLDNPVNDANDISQKLTNLGFQVKTLRNVDFSEMSNSVKWFKKTKAKIKLFYYAGHAAQVSGYNHLIPINSGIYNQKSLQNNSISVNSILPTKSTYDGITIAILDVCRNNPFKDSYSASNTRSLKIDSSLIRSVSPSLAPIKSASEAYIAFATSPGNVAEDGQDRNGTYTSSLIKFINYPGVTIEEMFKLVRGAVILETSNRQIPWEHSSLTKQVYLNNPTEDYIELAVDAIKENKMGLAYRHLKKARSTAFRKENIDVINKLNKKIKQKLGVI